MTDTSVREQSTLCVDCGALILRASVRLTSGARLTLLVESPDAPLGAEEALRIALDEEGEWVADHEGAFYEHSLDRCGALAARQ